MSGDAYSSSDVLRFFGMNPDRMSGLEASKHARTLLSIPTYAARWESRPERQAALLARLKNQFRPQPPTPPPGRQPEVPPADSAELAAAVATADGASRSELFIRYIDAQGSPSSRRVSVHQLVDWEGGDYALRAWCHERQDMRTFLISRVEEAVDSETGEIIDDLYDWFRDHTLDGDSDDELEPDDALGASLAVLIFIARADGRMVEAEREIIRDFTSLALNAMGLELLSHSDFDKRLARSSVSFPTFVAALEDLTQLPEAMRRAVLGVANAVVYADGRKHRFEHEAMLTLRDILGL